MSSKVEDRVIIEQDREIARLRAELAESSSRIPGPTRRVALGPHTLAHSRPLEPGESVEVVNESGRPWWVRAAREFCEAHPIDDRRERLRAEDERDAILRWAIEIGNLNCCEVPGMGLRYFARDAAGNSHNADTAEGAIRKAAGLDAPAASGGDA